MAQIIFLFSHFTGTHPKLALCTHKTCHHLAEVKWFCFLLWKNSKILGTGLRRGHQSADDRFFSGTQPRTARRCSQIIGTGEAANGCIAHMYRYWYSQSCVRQSHLHINTGCGSADAAPLLPRSSPNVSHMEAGASLLRRAHTQGQGRSRTLNYDVLHGVRSDFELR